jgi:hypothetical protein
MGVVRVGLAAAILGLSFSCVWGIVKVLSGPTPRKPASSDVPTTPRTDGPDLLSQLTGGGWIFADSPWEIKVLDPNAPSPISKKSRTVPVAEGMLTFGSMDTNGDALESLEYFGPIPGQPGQIVRLIAQPRKGDRSEHQPLLPSIAGAKSIAVRLGTSGNTLAEILQTENLTMAQRQWAELGWPMLPAPSTEAPQYQMWTMTRPEGPCQVVSFSLPGQSVTTLFVIREDTNKRADSLGKGP